MSDIKTEFKQWLQKNFKKSTADSYYSIVQKIFEKNFDNHHDWQKYSRSVMPLLARYFEFANKEYYLDRVTIWYALDYFDKISNFIYSTQKRTYTNEPIFKISLYDGKQDYRIIDTLFYELNDNIKYIARTIYNYSIDIDVEKFSTTKLIFLLQNACEKIKSINLEDVAIHISYKVANNSIGKTALSRYCDFLYATTHSVVYLYPSNELINLIKNRNPNKTIDGNFKEISPIKGFAARQVKPDIKVFRESPYGYPYTANDVAKIFDIDFNSVFKMMSRFSKQCIIKTVQNTYYGANAVDKCLKEYHHFKDKKDSEKYDAVDYSREGYQWWCTRKKALEILGIKKEAFYTHIAYECLKIDYTFGAPRYYVPEIEYFKNLHKIKRISRRKNNIIKNIAYRNGHILE